jgi:hypothetical protein
MVEVPGTAPGSTRCSDRPNYDHAPDMALAGPAYKFAPREPLSGGAGGGSMLEKGWSGYRESNPGHKLGRLVLYH